MQPPLATGRGPSPWRPPPHLRAGLTLGRLEVLAWIQLGALLLESAWLALLASVFFGPVAIAAPVAPLVVAAAASRIVWAPDAVLEEQCG
jgi:hypothetical protein